MTRHTGGCFCGAIRYEASGLPESVFHCHCRECRRNTGAAVATFAIFRPSDSFEWTQGETAVFESSPGVRRRFCPACGTPLSYEADKCPDEIHLLISTFDAPEAFRPEFHVFMKDRIPWFDTDDELPRHYGDI